jgi:PBP1b-binding outer membrane lipoprotein LpoB
MKNLIILAILFLSSCTTLKKAESYFDKHPQKAKNVAKSYILNHDVAGAKICIDAFPQKEVHDTISVVKDSLTVERITDTIFTWLTETKYVDKERIMKILIPCRDSIKIITNTIIDPKLKLLYDFNLKELDRIKESKDKISKYLKYTWIGIGAFLLLLFIFNKLFR